MATITISRQFGSGGDEIARMVADMLNYRMFDKWMILNAAKESGLSDQEIIDFSEDNYRVRGFLERLFARTAPISITYGVIEEPYSVHLLEQELSEETALRLVQKAVQSAHAQGNVVIVGRGGQVILQNEPNTLHVRIEAPLEDRILRVKQQIREQNHRGFADIQPRRQAQNLIEERDAASADYIKRFYEANWADPMLYHMVLNTGKLSLEQAAHLIVQAVKELESRSQQAAQPA